MSGFRAIVLCAGVGERLRPLTYKTNKSLLEIGGVSLVKRLLTQLCNCGISVAHVVVGHYSYKFRKTLPQHIGWMKVQFLTNTLYKITGGAQSLYTASRILRKHPCLIVDGDHYLDPSLLDRLMESEFENCILVDCAVEPRDEELAAYGQGGILTSFKWLPPYPPDALGEALGLFKLSKQASHSLAVILEHYLLKDGPAKREYVEPMNSLMNLHDIHYVETDGKPWIDIDFVEDYEQVKEMMF